MIGRIEVQASRLKLVGHSEAGTIVKAFLRDNGLTTVLVAMFLLTALGMIWSGHSAYNEELREHGSEALGIMRYLRSGDFLSALFENWESEFLQMSAYVILTAMLFQRKRCSQATALSSEARM